MRGVANYVGSMRIKPPRHTPAPFVGTARYWHDSLTMDVLNVAPRARPLTSSAFDALAPSPPPPKCNNLPGWSLRRKVRVLPLQHLFDGRRIGRQGLGRQWRGRLVRGGLGSVRRRILVGFHVLLRPSEVRGDERMVPPGERMARKTNRKEDTIRLHCCKPCKFSSARLPLSKARF